MSVTNMGAQLTDHEAWAIVKEFSRRLEAAERERDEARAEVARLWASVSDLTYVVTRIATHAALDELHDREIAERTRDGLVDAGYLHRCPTPLHLPKSDNQ